MKFLKFLYLFTAFTIFGCQSKDGDFTIFSEDEDLALGKQIAEHIEANPDQFPVISESDYPELYRHLNSIRDQILKSDELMYREEFSWELKVIDNDTIYNAFCTPGGFIYVYSGLIRFVQSTDELAGILAHEIAHGDLRHSTDQMTKSFGLQALIRIIAGTDAGQLTNIGVNLLGLKFSRSDEEQADEYAVKYLNDTDYNPRAFTRFFKRMELKSESMDPLQFLSTHPNPANRIEKIERIWEETGAKKGVDHSQSFLQLRNSLP